MGAEVVVLENMRGRDKAFNAVLGFSGVRWQHLQQRPEKKASSKKLAMDKEVVMDDTVCVQLGCWAPCGALKSCLSCPYFCLMLNSCNVRTNRTSRCDHPSPHMISKVLFWTHRASVEVGSHSNQIPALAPSYCTIGQVFIFLIISLAKLGNRCYDRIALVRLTPVW
jgi:hypothetical protein